MKMFTTPLPPNLLSEFTSRREAEDFTQFTKMFVPLEHILAVAGLLSPPLFLSKDLVFRDEESARDFELGCLRMHSRFQDSDIERVTNLENIPDFFGFLQSGKGQVYDEAADSEVLVRVFAETLQFFWKRCLEYHFPDRVFNVDILDGEEAAYLGEDGITVTFYQRRS